jgi:putative RecB family exonuclease
VSQLKTWTKCGERYDLERNFDLGEFPAAWTTLGTSFHVAYDRWESSGRTSDFLADFLDDYDSELSAARERVPDWRRWGKPPGMSVEKSISHYRNRGIKDIPIFMERRLTAEYEVVDTEVEFEIELVPRYLQSDDDELRIKGSIDCLLRWPDGSLTIDDVKTGSPDNSEDDIRQLQVYLFAGQKTGLNVTAARYWFTKLDRASPWVTLKPWMDEDYFTGVFETLDTAIGRSIFLPNPGKHCGLCSFKSVCSVMGDSLPEEVVNGEED